MKKDQIIKTKEYKKKLLNIFQSIYKQFSWKYEANR